MIRFSRLCRCHKIHAVPVLHKHNIKYKIVKEIRKSKQDCFGKFDKPHESRDGGHLGSEVVMSFTLQRSPHYSKKMWYVWSICS